VTADEAPLSERPREKPSRRLGLSGKLLLLTIPLVIFYEATIWIGWTIERRRARNAAMSSA
jgi:hypothetical protein